MICDHIDNWRAYASLGQGIAKALELLAKGELDALDEGKHELDGKKLYASVQNYSPKQSGEPKWESHKEYIDIQYIAEGSELMSYCPASTLGQAEPYNEEKDMVYYGKGIERGSILKVRARMFAIFFPQDGHLPGVTARGYPGMDSVNESSDMVKKILVKVAV